MPSMLPPQDFALFLPSAWNSLATDSVSQPVSSATQSCPTLCNPMDCSTPGLPVHHQLPELTQTHVHSAGDAMQPFYPLLSPSPAFNLSNPHLQVFAKWIFFSETIQCHWQPTSLSTPYPPSSVYF